MEDEFEKILVTNMLDGMNIQIDFGSKLISCPSYDRFPMVKPVLVLEFTNQSLFVLFPYLLLFPYSPALNMLSNFPGKV